ncbi:CYTH and CHAD domain-containing protein [Microvirga arabica]|uniref:CYTH and CHAD domain-containing protein n=1 Tax=Microvirga arabica TaxID=1128671 RepID=UPI00193AC1F0|nr:CYTH and CHAD domain-containing protein [Microvirga arabica]MBM1169572.1 CHAD domain-containing protein [Microvirga arabica]
MSASKEKSKQQGVSDSPREIELKLELASGTAEDLLTHPLIEKAQPLPRQSGQLHAVYFDTDDHALHREGISLRIRRRNGKAIQTIKAEGPHKGIAMDRGEWETPVDGELDLSAAAGTPLGKLIADEDLLANIKPAFTVETERRAFEAKFDTAMIEVALDRAKASGGDKTVTFSEIELELRQGHAGALFALARHLSETAPLRLSTAAKSERGYRLLDGESLRPARAEKIELPKDATCAEAFQVIARSCLAQMVQNEALVRLTQEPAALHQMRVGLRRLRAAISLFKTQLLTDPESAEIRDNLRWAGQSLGAARDLDVFIERLRSMDDAAPDPSQMEEIERRRTEAYRDLLETLESRRFMDVILQTAAWIEAGAWMASGGDGRKSARLRPAREFAAAEFSRRFKRIRKLAKHLRDIGDEERHDLRIRIKKLRYGTEFLGSLFTSGKARKRRKTFSSLLAELQEHLGDLNDLAVGGSLAMYLPEVSPKRLERQREKLLDKSEASLGALSRADPFWL